MSEVSCPAGTLSTEVRAGILLTACGCSKWACGDCSFYKVRRLVGLIVAGKPTTFLTFTWDTKRPESVERARQIMGEMWKLLVARIRRRYPEHEFHYVVTVETTKKGWPHFHVLARCGWIDQAWLSRQCAELWGAPVVDIQAVESVFGLAFYVSKYLAKGLAKIGNGKRFWFSQGYHQEADPEPARARTPAPWYRDPETPLTLLARYAAKGYHKVSGTDTRMVIARGQSP